MNRDTAEPGGCECSTCGAIFIGLEADSKCGICAGNDITAIAIESYFARGRDSLNAECPYRAGCFGHHWWTRGFAYSSRLLRAVRAESDAKELRAQVARLTELCEQLENTADQLSVDPFPRPSVCPMCGAPFCTGECYLGEVRT